MPEGHVNPLPAPLVLTRWCLCLQTERCFEKQSGFQEPPFSHLKNGRVTGPPRIEVNVKPENAAQVPGTVPHTP